MDQRPDLSNKRSTSITLLAIFLVIQGVLELLGIPTAFVSFNGTLATGLGITNLIITLAIFVLVWGLWTLKPWVSFWIAAVEALSLAVRVFTLFQPHANILSILLRMILPLLILIGLFVSQNRRTAFHL